MENNNIRLTFPAMFNETLRKYSDKHAYSFVGEEPKTFGTVNDESQALIAFLEKNGICPGDKVAILSNNMPNWGVTFFAITFMGAIVVPILPDFSSNEVENVIEHSGAKAIFISTALLPRIKGYKSEDLKMAILIEDFSSIFSEPNAVDFDISARPVKNYDIQEDDLASIIYTSGTTGRSKGVMLTHKNITFNALKGAVIQPMDDNDRFLSVLPLSHTYENTLGLVLPMLCGSCVYYLRKPPTPPVLLPALSLIKPTVMLTVPLIIEKVYFNKVLPAFRDKLILRVLYKIPLLRKISHVYTVIDGFWSWATAALLLFLLGWLPIFLGGQNFNFTVLSFNLPILTGQIMTISMFGMLVSAVLSTMLLPPVPKEMKWYVKLYKKSTVFLQWVFLPVTLILFGSLPALDAQIRLMLGRYMGFWVTEKIRK